MARKHLLSYTQYTFPGYVAEPAHALIAQYLDAVVEGRIQRLMIFCAPQHGKTELTTVRLPGFWLGRRPDDPVCIVTYGAELAEPKSRQCREIVEGPEYARLFPDIQVNPQARAMAHWELLGHRGFVHAVGVGGPITGHGVMLAIVDDPHKDYEAAMSKLQRDAVKDYYQNTLRTRVWENGAIVIINTRWSEDDLCGWLLREQPGEWEVLRLPALAETQAERDFRADRLGLPVGEPDPLGREPGEPLCPQRFSREALLRFQDDMSSLGWNAQYQGFPTAAEGDMFKRDGFRIIEKVPLNCTRLRYWDKAGTAAGGDYSVGVLMAYEEATQMIYIEDVVRGQWSATERENQIATAAQLDRRKYGNHPRHEPSIMIEQEPGSAGKESADNTIRHLTRLGFGVRAERPSGEKVVRARPYADWVGRFGVQLQRAAWNKAYVDELIACPAGTYWDQIDASSGAFNNLMRGGAWSRGYERKGKRR